ncbi:MAG: SsrA-binding protein SmpB [Gammaproteobacteria bacterium]|nr:SsrA-binding protein SmpB [Gammaproteobacteria bacterium]
MAKPNKSESNIIADNRKARHEYQIEEQIEAGLVLQGWEVKSLRAGRAQLKESYVVIKQGEAWLIGAHFSPLSTVSTHITADPVRTRKLLLHEKELEKLIGAVQRKGYTIIPLNLHWKRGNAKLQIAFAKGKKLHDKRATAKDRDWERQKQRLSKVH